MRIIIYLKFRMFTSDIEIDDAVQYINLGYGAQAQKLFVVHFFVILCCM